MAFPFVAPFDNWVKEVLKERESNKLISVINNPYAILSSGAKVVKSTPAQDKEKRIEQIKSILKDEVPPGDIIYNGCILANNISSLDLSYRTTNTAIGIDFSGRIIEVDNEPDRRVPTPIIESIDIDTDGANNTLKTAKIKLRCFTLKQLELFEMFYMKPGMNVLLEFGDSSILSGLLKTLSDSNNSSQQSIIERQLTVFRNGEQKKVEPISRVEQCLIPKQNLKQFADDFGKYFRSSIDGAIEYFGKIESSLGTYDLVAGKVTDYSFSINEDLTYSVDLEINQANQISLALPNNPKNKNSKANTGGKDGNQTYDEKQQIIDSIILNFDLTKNRLDLLLSQPHPEGKEKDWIKDEVFNYNKVDVTQKDNIASADPYISLRFILYILMNYVTATDGGNGVDDKLFKFNMPKYLKKDPGNRNNVLEEIDFIPVLSHKNIISTSKSVIFPTSELPIMIVSGKDNEILIDSKNRLDGRINGYNFHRAKAASLYEKETKTDINTDKSDPDLRIGNALNIFLRYDDVVRVWKQELYRIDFLEKILSMINDSSLGLFRLIYANQSENGYATIMDYKLCTSRNAQVVPIKSNELYRFNIGPKGSIVKQFSFNFELSNLVAGQTIFNANKFILDALNEKKNPNATASETIELPKDVYKSIDMSTMANADGYYAINYIEYTNIQAKLKDKSEQLKQVSPDTRKQFLSGSVSTDKPAEATTEEQSLADIVTQKSTKFIFGKEHKSLIYDDEAFIYQAIELTKDAKAKQATLSPIDVTLTVSGFSGFRCGYVFNIDGVPESYNQNGVFQITNVKHSISNEGWTTTIEAGYLPRKFD
jgi:hypothetical protein